MYLKKLELHGFKSFAHKTSLEFEPGITSIVGPNGSGKSNLADSIRWVFGEQSLKLLRSKKSEDVIFAGSTTRARLGAAEVSIYFDNQDRKMPIDYLEVVVSHRLFRNGLSEYLINGSQVRLLDIGELLIKSGFTNTSYCVIGQGTIEQLILGGPTAIKQMVEEASGIAPYYLKREKALRRLLRTEVNLNQVKALLEEILPRLRSLRRQTKRLEKKDELESQLKNLELEYYGQKLDSLEAQHREVKSKQAVFAKQIQDLNLEIKSLTSTLEGQEQSHTQKEKDLQKIRAELEALHKQKFALQEELVVIRGKIRLGGEAVLEDQLSREEVLRLQEKFESALQSFRELLENYDSQKAREIYKLFLEIKKFLEEHVAKKDQVKFDDLLEQEQRLTAEIDTLIEKLGKLEAELKNFVEHEEERKKQFFVQERLLRNKQETLIRTSETKNTLAVEEAKILTRQEDLETEARAELGESWFAKLQEPAPTPSRRAIPLTKSLQETILSLKQKLSELGGVDEMLIVEHQETEERYEYLASQAQDLEKGVKDLKAVIADLDMRIKKDFQEAFEKISEKFSEYFRLLFGGGRATMVILKERPRLEPEDQESDNLTETLRSPEDGSLNPPTADARVGGKTEVIGIEIKATPPGKKLAGIAALSGGERALTSIAFLSAILATYPSPFVILDEVDAALDEANSIRFGKILGTLAHQTQFITITHNRETMRQSHTLYGVTMGEDGVSKILSLKLQEAAVYGSRN